MNPRLVPVKFPTLIAVALLVSIFSAPLAVSATEQLTIYTDNGNDDRTMLSALAHAFEGVNRNIHVNLDVGPSGVASVKLVKGKVAAGKMDDVFIYFSGSLFQSLNPTKYLVDLTDQSWQSNIVSSFIPAVSVGTQIYGAPIGSTMGGGILYNKTVFKNLNLKVPLSWAEFMSNNAKIKSAGLVPVIQTYGDSWTSQLLVLADEYNLQAQTPNFPDLYTVGQAQFATTPSALVGFRHLEEIHKAGYQNKDFTTATLRDGVKYLVTGSGAQYPMFTSVSASLQRDYPKDADNIGFFALPGLSSASNGLTIWLPSGLFIPKSTRHLSAAKKFIAFATSSMGIAAMEAAVPPTGPVLVKGMKQKGPISTITTDLLRYLNTNGRTVPALEYVSPIKGPNLAKITVQVGSGLLTAKQGALAYDKDVHKEFARLGLPGWGPLTN